MILILPVQQKIKNVKLIVGASYATSEGKFSRQDFIQDEDMIVMIFKFGISRWSIIFQLVNKNN